MDARCRGEPCIINFTNCASQEAARHPGDRAMPPKVAREHLANMVGSNNTKAWLPAPVHLCLSSLCFVTATLGDGEGAIKLGSQYRLPVPGIRHAVETKSGRRALM